MRRLLTVTAMALACSGLSACNFEQKAAVPAPAVRVVQQPCNCEKDDTAAEAEESMERLAYDDERSYTQHKARTGTERSHTADEYLDDEYAQTSSSSSSSYSSSTSYRSEDSDADSYSDSYSESYSDSDADSGDEDEDSDYGPPPPPPARAHRWTDGYGRTHYYGATVGDPAHYEEPHASVGEPVYYDEPRATVGEPTHYEDYSRPMSVNSRAHKKAWWKYDADCKDAH